VSRTIPYSVYNDKSIANCFKLYSNLFELDDYKTTLKQSALFDHQSAVTVLFRIFELDDYKTTLKQSALFGHQSAVTVLFRSASQSAAVLNRSKILPTLGVLNNSGSGLTILHCSVCAKINAAAILPSFKVYIIHTNMANRSDNLAYNQNYQTIFHNNNKSL
jgi:hypothetical protein